jgi:hypothetical protein
MGDAGSETAQLELVKIANARILVLDDQPKEADKAIAEFIKRIGSPKT